MLQTVIQNLDLSPWMDARIDHSNIIHIPSVVRIPKGNTPIYFIYQCCRLNFYHVWRQRSYVHCFGGGNLLGTFGPFSFS